jgi:hypothetical protein
MLQTQQDNLERMRVLCIMRHLRESGRSALYLQMLSVMLGGGSLG